MKEEVCDCFSIVTVFSTPASVAFQVVNSLQIAIQSDVSRAQLYKELACRLDKFS